MEKQMHQIKNFIDLGSAQVGQRLGFIDVDGQKRETDEIVRIGVIHDRIEVETKNCVYTNYDPTIGMHFGGFKPTVDNSEHNHVEENYKTQDDMEQTPSWFKSPSNDDLQRNEQKHTGGFRAPSDKDLQLDDIVGPNNVFESKTNHSFVEKDSFDKRFELSAPDDFDLSR